ncbi:MAG: transposase [Spirochaetota bacterium]|nr:transposase [Spirochaetota bacterium]
MNTKTTIPKIKSTYNLQLSQWIYHCFPSIAQRPKQRKMLFISFLALLIGYFDGSIAALEERVFRAYGNNFLRYLLTASSIHWNNLMVSYERWVIKHISSYANANDFQIAISIDDSLVEKDKRSKHIAKGGKRLKTEGLSLLTAVLSVKEMSMSLVPRLCFRRDYCRLHGGEYVSKTEKAMLLLKHWLDQGLDSKNLICLFDSWYASKELINFCQNRGLNYVFGIKSNRQLNGRRIDSYKTGIRYVRAEKLSRGDYDYYLCVRRGKLNGVKGKVSVLISKRVRRDSGKTSWRYFCSNLTEEKVIFCWIRERWKVETYHQIFKMRFKPEKWRLHGEERMSHLLILTNMSMGFAVKYFLSHNKLELMSPGRSLEHSIMSESLNFIRATLISNKEIVESSFHRRI